MVLSIPVYTKVLDVKILFKISIDIWNKKKKLMSSFLEMFLQHKFIKKYKKDMCLKHIQLQFWLKCLAQMLPVVCDLCLNIKIFPFDELCTIHKFFEILFL